MFRSQDILDKVLCSIKLYGIELEVVKLMNKHLVAFKFLIISIGILLSSLKADFEKFILLQRGRW